MGIYPCAEVPRSKNEGTFFMEPTQVKASPGESPSRTAPSRRPAPLPTSDEDSSVETSLWWMPSRTQVAKQTPVRGVKARPAASTLPTVPVQPAPLADSQDTPLPVAAATPMPT